MIRCIIQSLVPSTYFPIDDLTKQVHSPLVGILHSLQKGLTGKNEEPNGMYYVSNLQPAFASFSSSSRGIHAFMNCDFFLQ